MHHQGAGRGQGVRAAGADGANAIVGLDDVTVAAQQKRVVLVGHDQQRLQVA